MKNEVSFHDKALGDVVQRSALKFENFQKHLDQTSADIRVLEKWLQGCGVCVGVTVPIENESISVAWNKLGNEWRLLCEFYAEDADSEDDLSTRPLIEMPFKIRFQCRPYLPVLVQKLAKLLPELQQNNEAATDLDAIFASESEIPF